MSPARRAKVLALQNSPTGELSLEQFSAAFPQLPGYIWELALPEHRRTSGAVALPDSMDAVAEDEDIAEGAAAPRRR